MIIYFAKKLYLELSKISNQETNWSKNEAMFCILKTLRFEMHVDNFSSKFSPSILRKCHTTEWKFSKQYVVIIKENNYFKQKYDRHSLY